MKPGTLYQEQECGEKTIAYCETNGPDMWVMKQQRNDGANSRSVCKVPAPLNSVNACGIRKR